ncbi:PLP-dependent transferase [Periconia macrospinosa]|uniref:PLP-dependent transferase n=1 Tax=Periconia macrospinosa TaxID=97972 RepID=A0A2V1EC73_9PLEO|nr:PLP-dependent transferase [Periconia macrospinosa]
MSSVPVDFVNGVVAAAPSSSSSPPSLNRADEVKELLDALLNPLILPFIRAADIDAASKHTGKSLPIPSISPSSSGTPRTSLVEHLPPKKLQSLLLSEENNAFLKIEGQERGGKDGLVKTVRTLLGYSVNTWDLGFLDKLYGGTNAVGVVSELLLATLNTNAHVYQVSPVLTLIEKHTAKYLSTLFFTPHSSPISKHTGGISQPGGSAANQTAMVVARNTLYPFTKTDGNGSHKFRVFTSAHGHYSLEKAAQIIGLGSKAVISVPVSPSTGEMDASSLRTLVKESKERGETPFFVNATAGTTVLGSFDPFEDISAVCKEEGLWMHIDGSWGGSVALNPEYRESRLKGSWLADSLTVNPHKMLGVPTTCSFLLARDLRKFHKALTLPAGYLFHDVNEVATSAAGKEEEEDEESGINADEIFDLADLTPQCGRRADSLKFFLALKYYGTAHFSSWVATAYDNARYLLDLVKAHPDFVSVTPEPVPCLQVCFYFARGGQLADAERNGRVTSEVAKGLIGRGFMVDYAPGEQGKFFRVVVNGATTKGTLDGLVKGIVEVAGEFGY